MKRSWRWYLAWGTMVASLSMLFFMVTAGPAMAWSQEENQFTDTGSGSGVCGDDTSHPCLYWQEPHNTSIKLYFYMDSSLITGAGGYDYYDEVLNAFNAYNHISAWNPYMYPWVSGDPTFGGSYSMGILPCGKLGNTAWQGGNIEYGWNPQSQRWENYSFFQNTVTTFNSNVFWNDSLDYTFTSCSNEHADGIENALHETGHVQGLGHTRYAAVMYPVASATTTPFEALQPNDIEGIKGIYPGNQQSD